MISTVAIETERGPSGKPVTRSRINGTATAAHYPRSGRIVLVADRGDWASALDALRELAEAVAPDLCQCYAGDYCAIHGEARQ